MKYISGAYVNSKMSMYPINDKRILKMIIQRQSDDMSVIEIKFSRLKYVKLTPLDEDYTSEILGATFIVKKQLILLV